MFTGAQFGKRFYLVEKLSAKYEKIQAKFQDKLFAAYPSLGDSAGDVFGRFAALDPTSEVKGEKNQFVYLEWICSRALKSSVREQDLYKIRDDLHLYMIMARLDKWRSGREGTIYYKPFVHFQVDQYKTIQELGEAVLSYQGYKDRKKSADIVEEERREATENSLVIYDGPEGRVVAPLTMSASQFWGKNTKWCISATESDNLFEKYYQEGQTPILMFLPKGTSEKFAFNEYDNSAARNVFDVAIYDPYHNKEDNEERTRILSKFVASVVSSGGMNWDAVRQDEHMLRTIQKFFIRDPGVYGYLLHHGDIEKIPDFLRPEQMVSFAIPYLKIDADTLPNTWNDGDEDHIDELKQSIASFLLHQDISSKLREYPDCGVQMVEALKLLPSLGNHSNTEQIIRSVLLPIFLPPEPPLSSAGLYLEDLRVKQQQLNDIVSGFVEGNTDWDEVKADVVLSYLKNIPLHFWKDEDFSVQVLNTVVIATTQLVEEIPEIFESPKVWLEALQIVDLDSDIFRLAKDKRFNHVWTSSIDGQPFIDRAVHLRNSWRNDIVQDIEDAAAFYEAIPKVEGIDWSPLVRKVNAAHPDGLKDAYQIELASVHMPECDFSELLEKSIAEEPDLFTDVDPDRQTEKMVRFALRHDPEALADVAARFFTAQHRMPELKVAFDMMNERESPYVEMVAHHFEPEGRSSGPA